MSEEEAIRADARQHARAAYEAIKAAMDSPRVVYTYTPPRVDDDATVKAAPFSLVAEDGLGPNTIATPSSWACHTITSGRLWDGDLLATYRRVRAQVVDAIAAGLRDAGLTDGATIDRLTAAIVKRLGEG